jgi:hypothetical protein
MEREASMLQLSNMLLEHTTFEFPKQVVADLCILAWLGCDG